MLRRHFLSLATAAALAASASLSTAANTSLAEIQSAIASGEPIRKSHVTAPWCGTCKRQKPIVAELLQTPELRAMKKIDVDFDSQRDVNWPSSASRRRQQSGP